MDLGRKFLLDNYKVISVLKQGANGTTELVLDADKTIYVRKRIPLTNLPYSQIRDLSCDHWPKIFFVDDNSKETIIVEEYIHGDTLENLLGQGHIFNEKEIREVAIQLCEALIVLHSVGVLHRDIKPANIMLTSNGRIKLIDFGSARVLKESNRDTKILVTPGYAPPEQYGFASTDERSDIYALGMTLKALGGEKFNSIKRVITRCIELDPKRRVANAKAVKDMLDKSNRPWPIMVIAVLLISLGVWKLYPHFSSILNNQPITKIDKMDQMPVQANEQSKKDEEGSTNKTVLKPSEAGISYRDNNKVNTQNTLKAENPKVTMKKEIEADFTCSEWLFVKETNPLYTLNKANVNAKGAVQVRPADGKQAVFEIHNKSQEPLYNPRLVLEFYNFSIKAKDFSVESWGRRRIRIKYDNLTILGYKRAIIQLEGSVLPQDYQALALYGEVYGYYVLGPHPSVTVRIEAQGTPTIAKDYDIKIQ